MEETKYRQCVLQKANKTQISYIPEQFAIVGQFLKLRQADGSMEDGWKVESTGEAVELRPNLGETMTDE